MDKINFNSINIEDFLKEQQERDKIFQKIADNIGIEKFDDEVVQLEVLGLYNWMNKFYDCSIGMFKGLAEVYKFDKSFSDILIKHYGEKMPEYLSNAIVYFCNKK